MQKIIISGCNGRMGHVVASLCEDDPELSVVAGIDILGRKDDRPSLSTAPRENAEKRPTPSSTSPIPPRWMGCLILL